MRTTGIGGSPGLAAKIGCSNAEASGVVDVAEHGHRRESRQYRQGRRRLRYVPVVAARRLRVPGWASRDRARGSRRRCDRRPGPGSPRQLLRHLIAGKRRRVQWMPPVPDAVPGGRLIPSAVRKARARRGAVWRLVRRGRRCPRSRRHFERHGVAGFRPAATRSRSGCASPSSTTATMPPRRMRSIAVVTASWVIEFRPACSRPRAVGRWTDRSLPPAPAPVRTWPGCRLPGWPGTRRALRPG